MVVNRRLRHVYIAVVSAAEQQPPSITWDQRLLGDGGGPLWCPAQLSRLEGQLEQAVGAGDYRESARLATGRRALAAHSTSHDHQARIAAEIRLAPSLSPSGQAACFLSRGFAVIPGAIQPQLLRGGCSGQNGAGLAAAPS
jgi:hypothetical protein